MVNEPQMIALFTSYGAVHGVDGLIVSDASIMYTATPVIPLATIMALARRNAHHYRRTTAVSPQTR
jgi:choline dehydrogenase-like flavoprotein